ncbi:MAG TPA: hypothetical protein VKH35_10740 [Thermoanaerobaculia bacterium]|nr:hypothetical protein [Thermoanaerobaculia bacterium]
MPSPVIAAFDYDDLLAHCTRHQPDRVWSSTAVLAEQTVALDSDDRALFDDFFAAFGGTAPVEGPPTQDTFVSATIRAGADESEFGCMWLRKRGLPQTNDDVFFGLSFPDCPFESGPSEDERWMQVWLPGEPPLFAFRDDVCLFRKSREDWRIKLLTLLYRGSLRLRDDLIFFHASALSIGGRGILIVGRRKAGKSTTSLALAARGHAILADSCACYAPATGELVPFRRPVGIREGPRAKLIDQALAVASPRAVERDESLRVDVATLLPENESGPVPASAIFFLRGFAPETKLLSLANDGRELANLRPIYSSFANAPHTQRVFELIRLLSHAKLYALWPGDPDETAHSIEEVMT